MTPHEYFTWFRFTREAAPRMVCVLRMPPFLISPNGYRCDGEEEALLIHLRHIVYRNHVGDLKRDFGRSYGWCSEIIEATREYSDDMQRNCCSNLTIVVLWRFQCMLLRSPQRTLRCGTFGLL